VEVLTFGTVVLPIVSGKTKFESKVEETTTYNAGLDFGLYNNRVTGRSFYKDSRDLLARCGKLTEVIFEQILSKYRKFYYKRIEFS
jgi:hypothetical protein